MAHITTKLFVEKITLLRQICVGMKQVIIL